MVSNTDWPVTKETEMTTVKCQHSGIEFEAVSTRTKQHPAVAELKASANKNGTYTALMTALETVRTNAEYTTIDEYVDQVNRVMRGEPTRKQIARQAEDKKESEYQERKSQNALLRENGYVWSKEEAEHDASEAGYIWRLFSPDYREVTVAQALAEIRAAAQIEKDEVDESGVGY